jgi:hypothetical protein
VNETALNNFTAAHADYIGAFRLDYEFGRSVESFEDSV